ncbi:DUF2933 domain-containing protein [Ancylobacter dichloromethanicus]
MTEHRAHLIPYLGYWPFLLILACPLMHVFHAWRAWRPRRTGRKQRQRQRIGGCRPEPASQTLSRDQRSGGRPCTTMFLPMASGHW